MISVMSSPTANRSRFRNAIRSPPPFVDQISDQAAPPGLMAGAQPHAGVAVVVLVEEQAIPPVHVFLKFFIPTETRTLSGGVARDNRNHTVGRFLGHGAGRDGTIVTA